MPTKPKAFLIDGHAHVYRAFHAIQNLTTVQGEPTGAIFGFLQIFQRIRQTYDPEYLAVVFDAPGPTFRQEVFPEYKATRPPQPPELTSQIETLKKLLSLMRLPMFEQAPFEADDILATLAVWAVRNGGEACIVSADKDLLQVVQPGVTILREHLQKIEIIDEEGVVNRLGVKARQVPDYLGLLGDSSDNIPGVPGIGKKRAADLLQDHERLEDLIVAAQGKTKPKFWVNLAENSEAALKSRELATVRTDVPVEVSWEDLKWSFEPTTELRDLLMHLEFRSFLEQLGGLDAEDRTTAYQTMTTPEDLEKIAGEIRRAKRAAIDTETTGLDPFGDELVGLSLSWKKNQAVYVPIGDGTDGKSISLEAARKVLGPLLEDGPLEWTAHNWNFDYKVLLRSGFPAGDIAFDTMIAAYVLNPSRSTKRLKGLSVEVLGIEMTEISELIGSGDDMVDMSMVDVDRVSDYACQDADVTLQLRNKMAEQLDEAGLRPLFEQIEMPLTTVLARMELEGIRIDREYFAELSKRSDARLKELTAEIYREAGRTFNINSPKQLAEILFDELGLPTGKKTTTGYSTDVTVLEQLAGKHSIAATLLEYRQLEKLRGTYIDSLPSLINPHTGKVHTSYNQTVAATGRLSSSDPNLQNIPVRTELGREIRRGFIPREGDWKLVAADYSQIELRILAHMSGDEALSEAFRLGEDIHTLTASKVFHVAPGDVTREMRGQAKAINFGIIYGMTAFRLGRDLGIPTREAEGFINNYFDVYGGVRRFIEETLDECRKEGSVRTLCGRRRFIPEIRSTNRNTRSQAERVAVNTPIQGTSADMIKLAMIRIDRRIRDEGLKARMILQVHDELIFDAPEEELAAVVELVPEEMKQALPLSVPIQVDVKTGENWAEI